jgi:hypothetical protein
MADIDQKLLAQQKELHEAQLAAQNQEAQEDVPGVSIAQHIAARDEKNRRSLTEKPEEMEADIRAEQLEAQNLEAQAAESDEKNKAESAAEKIQQIQKIAKKAQTTTRTVNFTTAASIIGLAITFIVMNVQLLAGNVFGVKWIPKLEVWEIALVGVLDFILWLIIMVIVAVISPTS